MVGTIPVYPLEVVLASPLIALFVLSVWLGFVLYMLSLVTRLVTAVERIADRMAPPARPILEG